MLVTAVFFVVGLAVGFGVGRIKNAAKLAAISAELYKAEAYVCRLCRKSGC
jgi:hypothetical protein